MFLFLIFQLKDVNDISMPFFHHQAPLKKKKKSPGILQEAYKQKNKTKQKSSINSEVHSDM